MAWRCARMACLAAVALLRGNEANTPMAVFVIVALHKLLHPDAGLLQAGKPLGGIGRAVLAGTKERLGVGVIITVTGAVIGGGNPQPIERLQQRFALHGTAVIGVQHRRLIDAALSQHSPAHHLSGVLGGFARVNLPADDFSAIEIDDQVEIEKQPLDWSGQPRDIPGPHLVGGSCHQPWRTAAAPVVVLVRLPQKAVETRLRGPILALIGQSGDDLPRRQARISGCVAERQHLRPLLSTELVHWLGTQGPGARIRLHWSRASPALVGAHVNAQLRARPLQPRPALAGLADQPYRLAAIWGADHTASPSPQIAWAFFRSTNSAAAS